MNPIHRLRRLAAALGRGSPRRARAARAARAASAAFAAVAMVALGAAASAPAMAGAAPSMITNGSNTNIAVQGPNHSLRFYWATNGVPGWNPEQVAGRLAPPTRHRR